MSSRPHLTDRQDTRVAEYRAVSSSAVAGLILGLLSPAAMIDPVLWAVPIAGIVFSSLSLRRIAQNAPALIGRKAAMYGLILSIFFFAAAASDWFAYRLLLRRQTAVPAAAKQHTEESTTFIPDPHREGHSYQCREKYLASAR